jgi:predicted SprT family Zn-dependent metalloprotease
MHADIYCTADAYIPLRLAHQAVISRIIVMEIAEAHDLAQRLIDFHGLTSRGWTFRFNRNKRRLGVCKQDDRRIELSEHYVHRNTREHVIDTILHEIAHALVGTQHGHDDIWKAMCLRIGASPASCSTTAVMPEGYWQAKCPGCATIFSRHRRPRRLRGRYCVACGPDRGQLVFADVRVVKPPRRITLVEPIVAQEKPKQLLLKLLFG